MVLELPSTLSEWLDLLPRSKHMLPWAIFFWKLKLLKDKCHYLPPSTHCLNEKKVMLTKNAAPACSSVCHSGKICTSRYHNTYFAPQHQHTSTYIRVLCWGQVRVARPRGGVSEKYRSLGRKCKGRTVRFCCLRPHLCLNKQFWCCILNKSAHAKGGKSDRKSSLFRSWIF